MLSPSSFKVPRVQRQMCVLKVQGSVEGRGVLDGNFVRGGSLRLRGRFGGYGVKST